MKKYLLRIEFRFFDAPKFEDASEYRTENITIGIFDTFEDAEIEGNKNLEVFEKHFKIHIFPKGNAAEKQRFSKTGGCFGSEKNLISNLAYLKTNFSFYAKIETLNYKDTEITIIEVIESMKRYQNYKLNL